MNGLEIVTFSGAMLLFAASPGPGLFAVMTKSVTYGFRNSFWMILGIVTGDLIFLNFAIFGLDSVSDMGKGFIIGVKYVGAIYLIYIGVKAIISTRNMQCTELKINKNSRGSYLLGLSIALSNPKVMLFYLGLLPSFIDISKLQKFDVWIISIVVATILLSVMATYAYLASGIAKSIANSKVVHLFFGAVLISIGIVVLVK